MNFDALRGFQEHLVQWKVPGNDCLVRIDHNDVYRHQCGYADMETGRKMRGDELYYMWSASKLITCTLGLMLYERGLFHLNDPLYEYLPEYKNVLLEVQDENGYKNYTEPKNPILVKHLFNMSAGFAYDFFTPAVQEVKKNTGGRCPTREVVRALAENPIHFEPGTGWEYSICHDILAGMIEVVAGMPLRQYAKKMLFDPLEMHDTCYNMPSEDKLSRMAVQYNYRDDINKAVPTNNTCSYMLGPDFDSGGAGVVSTIDDYMTFADALAHYGKAKNGEHILSEHTIRLMQTNFLTGKQQLDFNEKLYWYVGYGYGLGVRTMADPVLGGANSPVGEFGWGGAAGSYILIDPSNRLAMVYAHHMLNNQEIYFHSSLRNVLYGCLGK